MTEGGSEGGDKGLRLRQSILDEVLRYVVARNELVEVDEIAQALDRRPYGVAAAMPKLLGKKLVRRVKPGRAWQYRATNLGRKLAETGIPTKKRPHTLKADADRLRARWLRHHRKLVARWRAAGLPDSLIHEPDDELTPECDCKIA